MLVVSSVCGGRCRCSTGRARCAPVPVDGLGRDADGTGRSWPAELRLMVRVCLDSGFAMSLHWGPDLAVLYNDAFIPIMGSHKHPQALGRPTRDVWAEQWDEVIGPLMQRVIQFASPSPRTTCGSSWSATATRRSATSPSPTVRSWDPAGAPAASSPSSPRPPARCWPNAGCGWCATWVRCRRPRRAPSPTPAGPCSTSLPAPGRACPSRWRCSARTPMAAPAGSAPTGWPPTPGRWGCPSTATRTRPRSSTG